MAAVRDRELAPPPAADATPSRPLRRWVVGRIMSSDEIEETLLPKRLALPIFASDPISSVAYATESALLVLVGASLLSRGEIIPISIAVAAVLAIVVVSYRQTIYAYPNGGGSYVVARENLGALPGLIAAASLLVDYVLTVAVSVVSGVIAIIAAVPGLGPYRLELSLACVVLLLVANLRGVRESGRLFAAPTYIFIASLGLALTIGLVRLAFGIGLPAAHVPDALPVGTAHAIGLAVLLRAFASGCSALTGVEAISNGVPAFRRPQPQNAARTLMVMAGVAIFLFLGTSIVAKAVDARPSGSVSVLSEVARSIFPSGGWTAPGFYVVQVATFAVLVLAANTAFQGFPRLSALLAQDDMLPRQLGNLGDRLVYSNGMVALAAVAGALIVGFDANIDRLIQLYLVGVFTAFTLSQAGMVRRWWGRRATAPRATTVTGLATNGLGAVATGLVLLIVVATKFAAGAWMVTVAIPVCVAGSLAIRHHYRRVGRQLASRSRTRPRTGDAGPFVVVVDQLDAASADALAYARSVAGRDVQAVQIVGSGGRPIPPDAWHAFAGPRVAPLQVVTARAQPGAALARHLRRFRGGSERFVTVVLPERAGRRSPLAALRGRRLPSRLRQLAEDQVVVTSLAAVVDGDQPEPALDRVVALNLVPGVTLPALRGFDYLRTLRVDETRALSVAMADGEADRLRGAWRESGLRVPLTVLRAPYRDLGRPVLSAVREITAEPHTRCVVVVPELVVRGPLTWLLHNRRAFFIKRLLLFERHVAVVSVPYHVQ